MIAIETIAASATAPGAGGAAMTAVTGDSLRIRDAREARLLDVMSLRQANGLFRVTSPLLHDNTIGITVLTAIDQRFVRNGALSLQRLTPQDTLTLQATGSAVAGDVEISAMTIMYTDLAGIQGDFVTAETVMRIGEEVFMPNQVLTTTAAGWSGSTVLTTTADQWKANQRYAILGIVPREAQANLCAIGIVSPDLGNLRIAAPYDQQQAELCASYFWDLSKATGQATIPVINASQKSNIFVSGLANENAVTALFCLYTVRLGRKPEPAKGGRRRGK